MKVKRKEEKKAEKKAEKEKLKEELRARGIDSSSEASGSDHDSDVSSSETDSEDEHNEIELNETESEKCAREEREDEENLIREEKLDRKWRRKMRQKKRVRTEKKKIRKIEKDAAKKKAKDDAIAEKFRRSVEKEKIKLMKAMTGRRPGTANTTATGAPDSYKLPGSGLDQSRAPSAMSFAGSRAGSPDNSEMGDYSNEFGARDLPIVSPSRAASRAASRAGSAMGSPKLSRLTAKNLSVTERMYKQTGQKTKDVLDRSLFGDMDSDDSSRRSSSVGTRITKGQMDSGARRILEVAGRRGSLDGLLGVLGDQDGSESTETESLSEDDTDSEGFSDFSFDRSSTADSEYGPKNDDDLDAFESNFEVGFDITGVDGVQFMSDDDINAKLAPPKRKEKRQMAFDIKNWLTSAQEVQKKQMRDAIAKRRKEIAELNDLNKDHMKIIQELGAPYARRGSWAAHGLIHFDGYGFCNDLVEAGDSEDEFPDERLENGERKASTAGSRRGSMRRGSKADRRDSVGSRRDSVGSRRDSVGSRRDSVSSRRDSVHGGGGGGGGRRKYSIMRGLRRDSGWDPTGFGQNNDFLNNRHPSFTLICC